MTTVDGIETQLEWPADNLATVMKVSLLVSMTAR